MKDLSDNDLKTSYNRTEKEEQETQRPPGYVSAEDVLKLPVEERDKLMVRAASLAEQEYISNPTHAGQQKSKNIDPRLVLALVLICIGVGFAVGLMLYNPLFGKSMSQEPSQKIQQNTTPPKSTAYKTFEGVLAQIKTYYIKKISEEELIDNAIIGMVAGLDEHSAYIPRELTTCIQKHRTAYVGAQIRVLNNPRKVLITSVTAKSPTAAAGLAVGDYIDTINARRVKDMSRNEIYCQLYLQHTREYRMLYLSLYKPKKDILFSTIVFRGHRVRGRQSDIEIITPSIGYIQVKFHWRYV